MNMETFAFLLLIAGGACIGYAAWAILKTRHTRDSRETAGLLTSAVAWLLLFVAFPAATRSSETESWLLLFLAQAFSLVVGYVVAAVIGFLLFIDGIQAFGKKWVWDWRHGIMPPPPRPASSETASAEGNTTETTTATAGTTQEAVLVEEQPLQGFILCIAGGALMAYAVWGISTLTKLFESNPRQSLVSTAKKHDKIFGQVFHATYSPKFHILVPFDLMKDELKTDCQDAINKYLKTRKLKSKYSVPNPEDVVRYHVKSKTGERLDVIAIANLHEEKDVDVGGKMKKMMVSVGLFSIPFTLNMGTTAVDAWAVDLEEKIQRKMETNQPPAAIADPAGLSAPTLDEVLPVTK